MAIPAITIILTGRLRQPTRPSARCGPRWRRSFGARVGPPSSRVQENPDRGSLSNVATKIGRIRDKSTRMVALLEWGSTSCRWGDGLVAVNPRGLVQGHLRTLFDAGTTAGLTDGQLLERF